MSTELLVRVHLTSVEVQKGSPSELTHFERTETERTILGMTHGFELDMQEFCNAGHICVSDLSVRPRSGRGNAAETCAPSPDANLRLGNHRNACFLMEHKVATSSSIFYRTIRAGIGVLCLWV